MWRTVIVTDVTGETNWGNSSLICITLYNAATTGDGTQSAMARINSSVLGTCSASLTA